jgi:hypothetical protein
VENDTEGIIPEIWEPEEEKSLSIGQLKYHYLQLARQKFQGKMFINKDTKKPIKVSKDGIMEWWRKSRRREHIISVQLLDFFLENAIFIGESPDYLGRPKIISASQFESNCKINGKLFNIVLTTRKAIFDIDKLRHFSLKDSRLSATQGSLFW